MALKISTGSIPENAIPLTEREAVYYQWKQIRSWPNRWDVWPFFIGAPTLSLMSALTGLRINNHYRVKLKLRNYGMLSTALVISTTPAMFSTITHILFVTDDLFIDRKKCMLCYQSRAVACQIFSAIMYPVMMSPIANFMFAVRHGTYALPYWQDYRSTLKLWMTMNKSLAPKLAIALPLNMLAAFFFTYMEGKSLYTIKSKIENGEIKDLPNITIDK